MIRVRLKLFNIAYGGAEIKKAIALALFIKYECNSVIPHFSINKLHRLTGIHAETLRKRIKTMFNLGIAKFYHANLVVFGINSRHKKSNFAMPREVFSYCKTVKHYERVLSQFLVVKIQLKKDFLKRNQDKLANPKNLKEFKKARQISRYYGYGNEPYKEYGLSYNGIAKKLGVSRKTAVKVVSGCEANGLLVKHRNYEQIYVKEKVAKRKEVYAFYTFSTKNNVYIVHANTYSLTSNLASFYHSAAGNFSV